MEKPPPEGEGSLLDWFVAQFSGRWPFLEPSIKQRAALFLRHLLKLAVMPQQVHVDRDHLLLFWVELPI